MDKKKILEIVKDRDVKSNKDLLEVLNSLQEEFEQTKLSIVNLTHHMDTVEDYFYKVSEELKKRKIKQ